MPREFKSSALLTNEEVKAVLLEKINEERQHIKEDKADVELAQKVNLKSNKANVDSLFSGAGGLDLGLELAGLDAVLGEDETNRIYADKKLYFENRKRGIFNITYSNDMFVEANKTYENMFSSDVIKSDKDIRKIYKFPNCQVMVGGFPCPGFSAAGPRLIDDPRNFLYVHFIRALMETKPAFFIAENVKGLLTLSKGRVFEQLKEDFASAGYEVTAHLVNSRDYGVPQLRERVFIIGTSIEKVKNQYDWSYELPKKTHGKDDNLKDFVTLRDAIGDLPKNPDDVFEGTFSTIYMSRNRKKSWDDQSFTIQASGRQAPLWPGGEPMKKVGKDAWKFRGELNRRLSVREIARIQTFPDWYEFAMGQTGKTTSGKIDKQYKQIGNAVPVQLARKMIRPIADFFVEHPELLQK